MPPKPAHLAPSELGTKAYWDALYATELANHASNPDDTGTVWFDDADAEAKMVRYLVGDEEEEEEEEGGIPGVHTILDLGCGNGSLLRAVRDARAAKAAATEGIREPTRLLGVDYSEASLALARSILAQDGKEEKEPIELAPWDVLRGDPDALGARSEAAWDVVLDKGTFDAISLGASSSSTDAPSTDAPSVEERYRRQVLRLLRPGGHLLITSCNWTEAELAAWLGAQDDGDNNNRTHLAVVGRVAYPSFRFGGAQGQAVCTVCFEKRPS